MHYVFFLLLTLYSAEGLCQKGANSTRRFHKNKRLSTIEFWDKDRRNGQFLCMNAKGDTLVRYSLRRYAGHSSAWPEYYPNGQVRKLELSEAPDGGIQFYRETIYFDENGKITQRFQQSHEDRITPRIHHLK